MILLASLSLLLVLAAIVSGIYFLNSRSASRTQFAPPPSMTELAAQFPEISNILLDEKLDSVYKQFLIAYQEGGAQAAYELAKKRGILNDANEVRMTLELDTTETTELQAGLEAAGIRVTAVSGNLMDIAIPVEVLEASLESDEPGQVFMDISGLEHILRLQLPLQGMGDDVLSSEVIESLSVINADAWQAAGITGKGVKIGILDVGFDKYQSLLGGELPEQVVARSGIAGMEIDQVGETHGTSVAEVIHDIAPDAELYLTNYDTIAEMKQSVQWLVDQGVDIISNSTNFVYGPNDGSGILPRMVDDIVSKGVVWVNSAGNYRWEHYRSEYRDKNGDGWHEFDGDDDMMAIYPFGDATLTLFWDDWDNPTQNYDLYLYDDAGEVIASSINEQNGPNTYPTESLYYEFTDQGPYYVAIHAADASRPVMFNFFLRHGEIEYYSEGYSGGTPADSRSSLSVGAVNWSDDQIEDYSSKGPTEDGRLKPEISAPTNVISVAKGESFGGTSAAAPHVAGAVALVLQQFPDYTPQQVKDFLYTRAVDLGDPGPDYDYGNGRLRLGDPLMVEAVKPSPMPTELAVAPAPIETATREIEATSTSSPRRTAVSSPTRTPKNVSKTEGSVSLMAVLGFLSCVFLPGLLGIGGIGLLALVWSRNRGASVGERGLLNASVTGGSPPPPPRGRVHSGNTIQLICPKCGKANKPAAHFCLACGYDFIEMKEREAPSPPPLAAVAPAFCARCGQLLRKDSKFCPNCGNRIGN